MPVGNPAACAMFKSVFALPPCMLIWQINEKLVCTLAEPTIMHDDGEMMRCGDGARQPRCVPTLNPMLRKSCSWAECGNNVSILSPLCNF